AQIALLCLQVRHLAERLMLQHGLFLAGHHGHLFERYAVFEKHELHFVVVVGKRNTAQLDHPVSPCFEWNETARYSHDSGLRTIIQLIARPCYCKITMESSITMNSRNFSIETIGIVG